MVNPGERRNSPRVPRVFPMRYRLLPVAGDGYREGNVRDLSLEGLRFQCTGGLRPRVGMLLELMVPGDQPVHSFGRAAWVRELPGRAGFEVGGRFVDQSTAVRRAIERQVGA